MILEPKHIYSDCCGAKIYEDTDICSACKEHCEPQEEDETDFITNETI
jgi:hypothetical protein